MAQADGRATHSPVRDAGTTTWDAVTLGTRRWRAAVATTAVLVLAGGGTAGVLLLQQEGGTTAAPAQAAPSPTSAPTRPALLAAAPPAAPAPAVAGIEALVAAALADPGVAGRLAVSVVDVDTGQALYERAAQAPLLPASTAKIATAAAVLTAVPLDRRLATTVVAGPAPGEVVLVGGGDPTLTAVPPGAPAPPVPVPPGREPDLQPVYPPPASLVDLAAQVRTALGAAPVTRVLFDESLYSGERTGPGWRPGYLTDGAVASVTPLMVDNGRVRPDRRARHDDPGLAAGRALAALLAPGVPVVVQPGTAPAGATRLGEVLSPTVEELVERMLTRSDNDLAEALARQVALSQGQPASFAGASAAMAQVLSGRGVRGVVLADGSGLSRLDAASPAALTGLLARAASGDEPRLGSLVSGLPVAGFVGTLSDRYRPGDAGTTGAGSVRAKTGTLNDVSALAGLVRTADGRLLAFDVTADGVPPGATQRAEAALDAFAAGLAACGCR